MRRAALIALAAVALIGGCNKKPVETIDDAALAAIGDQVARNLNEPGAAVVQLVKALNRPTPIGFESMAITLDQKPVLLDWWLFRRGIVQLIQPQPAPDRPTFLISPQATAFTSASTDWFEAAAGSASAVDCKSPEALEVQGCLVEVGISPGLTEAGKAALGEISLNTIKVHALVSNTGGSWQVNQLSSDDGSLHDYALTVILGPEAGRAAARQAMLNQLDVSASGMGAPAAEGFGAGAPSVSIMPLDTTPVTPVAGDSPFGPPPKRLPPASPAVP